MVQPFDTVKGVQRRMSHVVEVWLGVVEAVATECRVRIVKAEKGYRRYVCSRFEPASQTD
jgi:exosome complex RNA-binding protein Csl4